MAMRNILSIIFFVSLVITSCTKEYILSVNVTPSGSGQVMPDVGTFDEGSSVTLSAIPSNEYVFVRWSGSANGSSNPIQVSMNSDKNITAQFALKKYPLNIETVGSGAVNETIISTGKGTEYDSGTIVRLEAIPSTGYYFSQWSGDLTGTQNPATITIGEPKSVVARFEKEDYLVDIKVSGEGEVIKEILNTNKSDEYPYGTRLRLTPEPKDGNIFLGWVVDGIASTDSIIEVDVNNIRKISASFENELASRLLKSGVGKWKVRRRVKRSNVEVDEDNANKMTALFRNELASTTSFSNSIRSLQFGLSISSSSTSTTASEIGFPQFFKLYALLEFEKSTTIGGEIIAVERYQSVSLVDIFVNNNGISVLDFNPIESPIIVDPNPGQTVSTATSTNTVSQDLYSYSTQGEVQINSLENGQFNASFDLNFTPNQGPLTGTSTPTILDTFEVEDEVTSDIDDNFQIGSIYIPLDYVEQRLVESGIDDIVDGYVKESLLLDVESINLSGLGITESDLEELYEVLLAFPNLQSLDLSNNSISIFDSSIIYLVSNLNLSSNLLTSIDISFLTDNYSLNLSGNTGLTCIEVNEEFINSPPSNLIVDDISVLQLDCNCSELTLVSGSLNQTLCEGVDSFEPIVFEYSGENVSVEINDSLLPAGITYQTTSDKITFSGNPSFGGQDSYSFSVAVVKPNCDEAVENITISRNSSSASLTITGSLNQTIQTFNQIETITLTYGGSTSGIEITGLPSSISINQNGNTYTISGLINQAGEYTGQITTQNSGGCGSTIQNITIVVTDPLLTVDNNSEGSTNDSQSLGVNSDELNNNTSGDSQNQQTSIIWNGPLTTFSKSDRSDPLEETNQDRLTTDVWITRGNNGGQIYNAAVSSNANKLESPLGTEWAIGSLDQKENLTFQNFRAAVNNKPKNIVGIDLVLHLIQEDIYLIIRFTSWSSGQLGGFSYQRSTP